MGINPSFIARHLPLYYLPETLTFIFLLLELLIHGCLYNIVTSQILQGSDIGGCLGS